jgi:hypothetical protein
MRSVSKLILHTTFSAIFKVFLQFTDKPTQNQNSISKKSTHKAQNQKSQKTPCLPKKALPTQKVTLVKAYASNIIKNTQSINNSPQNGAPKPENKQRGMENTAKNRPIPNTPRISHP